MRFSAALVLAALAATSVPALAKPLSGSSLDTRELRSPEQTLGHMNHVISITDGLTGIATNIAGVVRELLPELETRHKTGRKGAKRKSPQGLKLRAPKSRKGQKGHAGHKRRDDDSPLFARQHENYLGLMARDYLDFL